MTQRDGDALFGGSFPLHRVVLPQVFERSNNTYYEEHVVNNEDEIVIGR